MRKCWFLSLHVAVMASCADSEFSGGNGSEEASESGQNGTDQGPNDRNTNDLGPDGDDLGQSGGENDDGNGSGDNSLFDDDAGSESRTISESEDDGDDDDQVIVESEDEIVFDLEPDYDICKEIANFGKRRFGKCDANQVIVIINDGVAPEMTCCPVDPKILTDDQSKHQIQRTHTCLENEVATGFQDARRKTLYCTEINTSRIKITEQKTAQYAINSYPGILGEIASTYNQLDTCICPEGTVLQGNHSATNNVCTDTCVRLENR